MSHLNYYEDITIIIISYKSTKKVINFVKLIPNFFKIIIVENSNDHEIKKEFENKNNIDVFLRENNGVSSSLNFVVSKIKTNYFFQVSPDLIFDFNNLEIFYTKAKDMDNKFSALGPRFANVKAKSHKQSNPDNEIGYVKSIHGSAMFINKKVFERMRGFDENIFLYFEETDYCKRCEKENLKAYQLNKVMIKQEGRSVSLSSSDEKNKLEKLLTWHFIWSKYYYYNKHYGNLFSLIYFQPILIRSVFKMIYFYLLKNNNRYEKYKYRINGLLSSLIKKNSYLRIDKIL